MKEQAPIIVFGAPRSGTTYLQRLLDVHPDIYLSHETRVFAWMHAAITELTANENYLVTARTGFVRHLEATLPDVVRGFYEQLSPDTRYWGDKNPHYADPRHLGCLDLIARLFPGASFVHIIRDGRDVVASLLRRRHADGQPWADFAEAHEIWTSHLDVGCWFGATPGVNYYEIRYEDLVTDDLGVVRKLYAFLGIELDPAVEAFCAAQREQRTPLSEPTRRDVGVVTSSDWDDVILPSEQVRSLDLLAPYLVRHGYETHESLTHLRERAAARGAQSPESDVAGDAP